jgi:hypothetical protein
MAGEKRIVPQKKRDCGKKPGTGVLKRIRTSISFVNATIRRLPVATVVTVPGSGERFFCCRRQKRGQGRQNYPHAFFA